MGNDYNFIEYLFQYIYIIPTSDSARYYKQNIVQHRLNINPSQVSFIHGEKYKPLACFHSGHSSNAAGEIACFLESIEDAIAKNHRTILILKDNTCFHKNIEYLLRDKFSSQNVRPWKCINFGENAYAIKNAVFNNILPKLYTLSTSINNILTTEYIDNIWYIKDKFIINEKNITPLNWDEYLYNYDFSNKIISFCCVTRRANFVENIVLNYKRQSYIDKELIIAINTNDVSIFYVEQIVNKHNISDYKILKFDENISLGECLNETVKISKGLYWCKIDDDDFYDTNYLMEAYEHMVTFKCDIVGKNRVHVFFPEEHKGYITTDAEYKHVGFPRQHGATIFTRRDVLDKISFPKLNLSEDEDFYKKASDNGLIQCNTTLNNYIYMRHNGNTSKFERERSVEWNTCGCRLYESMLRKYEMLRNVDYNTLSIDQFADLFNKVYSIKNKGKKIPKIIHQIWIGSSPKPHHWTNSWEFEYLASHPDWEYKLWTENNIGEFDIIHTNAYAQSDLLCKADLLRYSILYKYGGIYIDADSLYINSKSLEDYIESVDKSGIIMVEEPFQEVEQSLISIGVIASVAGNELLKYFTCRAVNAINDALEQQTEFQAWQVSGPLIVTQVMKKIHTYGILPSYIFYPEYWNTKKFWGMPKSEIEQKYPESIMFQFGYSTNNLLKFDT